MRRASQRIDDFLMRLIGVERRLDPYFRELCTRAETSPLEVKYDNSIPYLFGAAAARGHLR
ncbi:MAG TPA: hypothetical protein VG326_11105 [Tepidisphaeraceae bacterium]|jgi:hypothetical protein|nr:hypothetical protein [Tepidisphaeraceae bacterium]